ncbi:MAG: fructosamine kinase family protein [Chitinophagales bacterium]
MLPTHIKQACEQKLSIPFMQQVDIDSFQPITGGSINDAGRITTNVGDFFIKWNSAYRFPMMFELEAKGLELLRSTEAISVPEPMCWGQSGTDAFLVMEYLDCAYEVGNFWEEFGHRLANLHLNTTSQFGLNQHNYMGSLRQFNRRHDNYIDFFIQERLGYQVKLGRDHGILDSQHVKQFESLYRRLPELIPEERPALVHGDLWSGNFTTDCEGYPALIDPAVHYGHREADLAMTFLFGGFNHQLYDAYHNAYPLTPSWRWRMDLYNLYPLLVHINLFAPQTRSVTKVKSDYLISVESTLKRMG